MPPKKSAPPKKRLIFTPITEEEMTFAHLCIAGNGGKGMTCEQAAERLGYPPAKGRTFSARVPVRAYVADYRKAFMLEMARNEAIQVQKFEVTRAGAVALLWKLANTAPERTRGTIAGQVEAVSEIGSILGWEIKPRDFEEALGGLNEKELAYVAEHGQMPPKTTVQ